jgi:sugar/nucleoside kinase (ribokinase family)
MSLLVVGSVAYDGIETPHGKVDRMLGGSSTYIAIAASYFTDVQLVGVIGDDFSPEDIDTFKAHSIDLEGLERLPGKTFYWSGVYSRNMNERTTLTTDLNVFADFDPKLPETYCSTPYAFLGNIHPVLQRKVRSQLTDVRLIGGDTMNFWIEGTPKELSQAIAEWDVILINDQEARELSGEYDLWRAARYTCASGPKKVVIKRGEYGAVLFDASGYFVAPGFLLETVLDPTGAGDSFAGGFMGYLAGEGLSNIDAATESQLRKAMIYGSVMGSFCCEQFGIGRLRTLARSDIEQRFEEFRKLTQF